MPNLQLLTKYMKLERTKLVPQILKTKTTEILFRILVIILLTLLEPRCILMLIQISLYVRIFIYSSVDIYMFIYMNIYILI